MKRNIAVIGCGNWGRNHIRVLNELGYLGAICDPLLDVITVGDGLTREKRKMIDVYPNIKHYLHYKDVLNDASISAVVIVTPAITHHMVTMDALMAGKHVLVEKPMAVDVKQATEMLEYAYLEDLTLMVGHILEYHPSIIVLKDYIKNGGLGEIQYMYSNRLNIGKIRREENVLWSFAPHDIGLFITIAGSDPLDVSVNEASYITKNLSDITIMHFEFPGDLKGHIFVSWLHPVKEQKLIIIGTKAMAVFDDQTNEKVKIYEHKIKYEKPSDVIRIEKAEYKILSATLAGGEPLKDELKHFIECIETGERPRTDGDYGKRVLKILEACK